MKEGKNMLENFLKKSSWTDIVVSLIFILFGIVLIARPNEIMSIISFILGGIVIIMGILKIIDYMSGDRNNNYLLAMAIVAIIAGIIIMFCSNIILSVFRILFAI